MEELSSRASTVFRGPTLLPAARPGCHEEGCPDRGVCVCVRVFGGKCVCVCVWEKERFGSGHTVTQGHGSMRGEREKYGQSSQMNLGRRGRLPLAISASRSWSAASRACCRCFSSAPHCSFRLWCSCSR